MGLAPNLIRLTPRGTTQVSPYQVSSTSLLSSKSHPRHYHLHAGVQQNVQPASAVSKLVPATPTKAHCTIVASKGNTKMRSAPSKMVFALERPIGQNMPRIHVSLSSGYRRRSYRTCSSISSSPASNITPTARVFSPLGLSIFSKSASIGTKLPSNPLSFGFGGLQMPSKRGPCSTLVRKERQSS